MAEPAVKVPEIVVTPAQLDQCDDVIDATLDRYFPHQHEFNEVYANVRRDLKRAVRRVVAPDTTEED